MPMPRRGRVGRRADCACRGRPKRRGRSRACGPSGTSRRGRLRRRARALAGRWPEAPPALHRRGVPPHRWPPERPREPSRRGGPAGRRSGAGCEAHDPVCGVGARGDRRLTAARPADRCDPGGAERSLARDRFEVVTQFVSEPMDLLRMLRKLRPTVVYFASDGGSACGDRPEQEGQAPATDWFGGLCFRGAGSAPAGPLAERGPGGALRSWTLGAAFVVLSGCYGDPQAKALLVHVDCVAGTSGAIGPEASQAYVVGFLGALGDLRVGSPRRTSRHAPRSASRGWARRRPRS